MKDPGPKEMLACFYHACDDLGLEKTQVDMTNSLREVVASYLAKDPALMERFMRLSLSTYGKSSKMQ